MRDGAYRALALSTVLAAAPVHADVPRCASGSADVRYEDVAVDRISGDTGWFPSGAAAQLRLTAQVAGLTTVAMELAPTACWESEMRVRAPGEVGGGLLDFAYGAELRLYAQIHTTILGNAIDWSGEVPLPTDLLLASSVPFDATLLPGSPVDHASGTDATSPVTLFNTGWIAQLIDIAGISGGLYLAAAGSLTTTYRTDRITIADEAMVYASDQVTIPPPSAGFGAALEVPARVEGTIEYAPALTFNVGFNVTIFYVPVIDITLFGVTLPLPRITAPVTPIAKTARVPLPKAASLANARVDFASGSTQTLLVRNVGEAPLVLEPLRLPPGVTCSRVMIAHGETGELTFSVAPGQAIAAEALIATNDPGQPTVPIALGRDIGGTGVDEAGGGGCAVGRHPAGVSIVMLVAPVMLRRRRRRAAPRSVCE